MSKTGRPPKPPLYVLPHGIEVIGEYPPRGANRYWRVRIRPHPFFDGVKVVHGGCYVRRNRVILASKLGRALTQEEHAHHADEDRGNDAAGNIERLTPAEHNRHHKTGAKHTAEAKQRISAGLKRAISEGVRPPPPPPNWTGRKHTEEAKARMSSTRRALISSGALPKSVPPSGKGRPMSDSAKERIRAAKLAYWARKKEQHL